MSENTAERDERIATMKQQLADQFGQFPLTLKDCRHIDFHFNKGSLEYDFLPMWTLKTQGKSYYVHHLDTKGTSFSTRELPEGSTRGMLRFRNADLTIDKDGVATISPARAMAEAA